MATADEKRFPPSVLRFPQKLLLAHVIQAYNWAYPNKQAAFEGCQCTRNAAHGCFVHQLQSLPIVNEPIEPYKALCNIKLYE